MFEIKEEQTEDNSTFSSALKKSHHNKRKSMFAPGEQGDKDYARFLASFPKNSMKRINKVLEKCK
jgi:hypothetical protein